MINFYICYKKVTNPLQQKIILNMESKLIWSLKINKICKVFFNEILIRSDL